MENSVQAAIGLGSNLGNSLQNLQTALTLLNQQVGVQVAAVSRWYQTVPVGPPQPDYINGCAILKVTVSPDILLQNLLEIEIQLGRVRRERWGPRTLDLDLLLFDHLILTTPTLEIPHPHMAERAFVLVPLAEIAPQWVHPMTGKTIQELRDSLDCQGVKFLE